MVKVSGQDVVLGYVPVASWDTPTLATTGHKMPFITEGLTSDIELVEDPSLSGAATQLPGTANKQTAEGPVEHALSYQGMEHLFGSLCSSYAAALYSAGPEWKHDGGLKVPAAGRNFTVAVHKTIRCFEYANARVRGIEVSGNSADGIVRASVDWLANKANKNAGTGTNNTTTKAGVTAPTYGRDLVRFRDLIVVLNTTPATAWVADGTEFGTIAANDKLCISEFGLNISLAVEGDQTSCSDIGVEEPSATDLATVELSLTVPYYADTYVATQTLQDLADSKATFGIGLYFSGPPYTDPITDENRYRAKLFLLQAQASVEGPNAGGPGKMPLNFTIMAKAPAATIAGAVPSQDPFWYAFINNNTTAWTWA